MSLECQDLLKHMLVVEPTRRYALEQVMAHGWLKLGVEAEYLRFVDDVRRFSGHACVDYSELSQLHGHFRQMAITASTPCAAAASPSPMLSSSAAAGDVAAPGTSGSGGQLDGGLHCGPGGNSPSPSPQLSARHRARKRTIVAVTLDSLRQEQQQQQQSPTYNLNGNPNMNVNMNNSSSSSANTPPQSASGDLFSYHVCAGAQLDAYDPNVRVAVLDYMTSIGISREQVFQVVVAVVHSSASAH